MIDGSCLCGQVRFTLNSQLYAPRFCHCSNCRKFSGTTPGAWAMANAQDLETSADVALGSHATEHGVRYFCSVCGSPVWFESKEHASVVGIALGSINSGPVPEPDMELWCESMPSWAQPSWGQAPSTRKKFPRGPG